MPHFLIKVTQLVSDENLSKYDDLMDNPAGTYEYEAEDGEAALDEFHDHIPIGCLDDFQIEVIHMGM